MAASSWVDCPTCGTTLKHSKLEDHLSRVHPGGARTTEERDRRQRRLKTLRYGLGGLLAALVVVGLAWAMISLGDPAAVELSPRGEPTVGAAQAPVTIYLFEDHQCPSCAAWEADGGLDHVLETWVEPGHARLVYKDLAFISEGSIVTAEASQAVWQIDPEAWLSWHAYFFDHQGAEGSGWASQANVVAMTQAWGDQTPAWSQADMEAFRAQLADHVHRGEVLDDIDEAKAAGVQSTPTMVIGGERVPAHDLELVDGAVRLAYQQATGQAPP